MLYRRLNAKTTRRGEKMDLYCEQNVLNENLDKKAKKFKTLKIIRYAIVGLTIIAGYICVTVLLNFTPIDKGWGEFILQLLLTLAILSPFVVAFILIGRYVSRNSQEFDYYVINGNFRIVKVLNRIKRRKMMEFPLSSVESMGLLQSETYDRYAANKEIKKEFALCNYEDEEKVIYMYFFAEGTKKLLHIEPSNDMLIALKRSMPRLTVLDKSLKLPAPQKEANNNDDLSR